MPISEILSEELEVVNAIFGSGTCEILSNNTTKTRVQLRLPAASFDSFTPEYVDSQQAKVTGSWQRKTIGKEIVFTVDFPAAYPNVMPRMVHFNTQESLYEYSQSYMWKVHLAMLIFLKEAFVAGEVCIYDWFILCLPAVHCLDEKGFNWKNFAVSAPIFNLEEKAWRWAMRRKPVDMKKAMDLRECAICLDEHALYEMIDLPCGDVFCSGYFHEGWDVFGKAKAPFECCGRRVPTDLGKIFIAIDEVQAKRYETVLLERDTVKPVFCFRPDCEGLLGGLEDLMDKGVQFAQCPECEAFGCVICGSPCHVGECISDDFAEVMKQLGVRRCPRCGHGTMKDGGCSHMRCEKCGSDYTWQSDGGTVAW